MTATHCPGWKKIGPSPFLQGALGLRAWLVLVLFLVVIFPIPPQLSVFSAKVCIPFLFVCSWDVSYLHQGENLSAKFIYLRPLIFTFGWFATARLGEFYSKRFLELLRPLFWFVIFSLFYSVFGRNKSDQSLRLIMNFILFVAVWGIAEALLPLPSSYYYIYRLPGSVYAGKAIASFIAPYAYAAVIGIGAIFFFTKSKTQNNFKYLSFSP